VATYLDDIVAYHRARVAADDRSPAEMLAAIDAAPAPRPFAAALRRVRSSVAAGATSPGEGGPGETSQLGVIAEVKRRSPSKGALALDLDPAATARAYEAGGASCVSVLTDEPHFSGSRADLIAAREAIGLPVLRKDFTVSRNDVLDGRAMGADAVLLIVAALGDDELADFVALAAEIGLAALVEIHDEAELARALEVGAELVGVNQRDLHTFAVDTERAVRVGASIPDGVVRIAESGIATRADVERLEAAGFDAILVGEALVTDGDPKAAIARLVGGR
jgi:indole-3-glycerol phosphate synthase